MATADTQSEEVMTVEATATPVRAPDLVVHERAAFLPELVIADRCCRCGAQARVSLVVHEENTPLLFCHHDFEVAYPALMLLNDGQGPYAIRDERDALYREEGRNRHQGADHA